MPPPKVFMRPKPAKDKIQIIAEVIAGAQHQQAHDGAKVNGLASVMLVDDEGIDKPTHGSTHPKWTEEDCPHEPREHVFEA